MPIRALTLPEKLRVFLPLQARLSHLCHQTMPQATFNKVVQRIPVRIAIDSSPHIDLIKPGMSVSATVDLRT